MSAQRPSAGPILGTAPRGPGRLALDLYRGGGSFRGFVEFAAIGVVLLFFMASSATNIDRLAGAVRGAYQATGGTPPAAAPLQPSNAIPTFASTRALAPRISDIGLKISYFASEADPLRTQLQDAARAYRDRDYQRSVRLLENADMDRRLVLLMRGLATIAIPGAPNFQSGFGMLERAVALGEPKAMAFVGVMKVSGLPGLTRDIDAGRALLERASEAGEPSAPRVIGEGYINGWMGSVDLTRGAAQLRIASDRGDVRATRRLAEMYFTGTGLAKDHAEAERLMETAANANDTEAQALLGTWRLQPYISGVTADPNEALRWLEKAAARGHPRAMEYLGLFYVEFGKRTKREDLARGAEIFRRCAEMTKDSACLFSYGTALYFGYGVPRDPIKAYGVLNASNVLKPSAKAADRLAELSKIMSPEEIRQARAIGNDIVSRKPAARPSPAAQDSL